MKKIYYDKFSTDKLKSADNELSGKVISRENQVISLLQLLDNGHSQDVVDVLSRKFAKILIRNYYIKMY